MAITTVVPDRFITIRDFAQRSTLSRSEIYNLIAEGELPRPTRLSPNRVAFPESVWTEWATAKMGAQTGGAH